MKNKLTKLIEKSLERTQDEPRNYIGASSIGSDCLRQIWYQFKGVEAESVPVKFIKIWAVGKHLEQLVVDWLTNAGVTIERNDTTYQSKNVPEFQGHFDGIITSCKNRAILEIKTAKDASFKIFEKKGLKVWNPQYYAQVQSYMGMSGIGSTYILVLNKDNSDSCDELVSFDEEFYQKLEDKALMISSATVEPPRIHGSPLWFQCKLCKYNKVCHK
jgi:YqaJ-like viral recombinase domain